VFCGTSLWTTPTANRLIRRISRHDILTGRAEEFRMYTITSSEHWSVGPVSTLKTLKPEWFRVPDAIRVSGISRSSLYTMIKEGKIKSVCLRKRNSIRGIRLVNADSLSAFIESFANGDDAAK
jgi:hypothetical protein